MINLLSSIGASPTAPGFKKDRPNFAPSRDYTSQLYKPSYPLILPETPRVTGELETGEFPHKTGLLPCGPANAWERVEQQL